MPFIIPIEEARRLWPEYEFITSLTPSEQKAAFHVRRDGNEYCLKVISPTYTMDRLQREVLAMQRISHPNVVRFVDYQFRVTPGEQKHYLVEEFVPGSDLSAHLMPRQPWPVQRIARIFRPLCEGLEQLRIANIVHCDLKPSNVRLRPDETPVIIDFGLARHLDLASITNTRDGAQIGTPIYFAPEQFKGTKHDIDHRTDLYAVGVLMYEAAVGFHPSMTPAMKTVDELSAAVCESDSYAQHREFGILPERLRTVITRLLAKERAKRPQTADVVATMLARIEEEK